MKFRNMACLLLVGLSLLPLALCISCGKSGSSIPIGETELPDMELRNADYTLAEALAETSPDDPLFMHAALISIYSTGKDTVLTDVSFRQGTSMSGRCKSASVSSDNNKAILSGDVFVDIDNDFRMLALAGDAVDGGHGGRNEDLRHFLAQACGNGSGDHVGLGIALDGVAGRTHGGPHGAEPDAAAARAGFFQNGIVVHGGEHL